MSIPVNIYVQSKDLKDLVEFYETKLKLIKAKRKDLEKDESEIRATIMQLKAKQQSTETLSENSIELSIKPNKTTYSKKWTWVEKIEFAIREAGKPINTSEIVDLLILQESSLDDEKRRSVASVSSILSIHSGANDETDKKFIKIEDLSGRSKFFVRDQYLVNESSSFIEERNKDIAPDSPVKIVDDLDDGLPF